MPHGRRCAEKITRLESRGQYGLDAGAGRARITRDENSWNGNTASLGKLDDGDCKSLESLGREPTVSAHIANSVGAENVVDLPDH